VAASSAPGGTSRQISWFNRLLGPLALIAALIAIVLIVNANTGSDSQAERDTKTNVKSEGKSGGSGKGAENPKTYTVEEGDTLSGVAAKFDVSVKRLERLNPDIDPQTLAAGQELKIR